MAKKIRLATKSRSNRMFFDNLIKEMAICINVGDTCINRDLELFSYRGKKQNIGFDTPGGMLSDSTLTAIDLMLSEAMRQGLTGCNSRIRISDFIKVFKIPIMSSNQNKV